MPSRCVLPSVTHCVGRLCHARPRVPQERLLLRAFRELILRCVGAPIMPARLPRRLDMRERVGDARRRSATLGELHLDHEHNLVRDVRTAMCGCRHSRRSRATTRRTRPMQVLAVSRVTGYRLGRHLRGPAPRSPGQYDLRIVQVCRSRQLGYTRHSECCAGAPMSVTSS